MGKNNKQRRAAKAKKRREQGRQRERRRVESGRHRSDETQTDQGLIMSAVHAHHQREDELLAPLMRSLLERPRHRIASTLQRMLELQVSWLWTGGWQPADLVRVTERKLGDNEAELVRSAIAADAATYEQIGREVALEWKSQLDSAGAERWWDPREPWLLQLGRAWPTALDEGVQLMNLLGNLPEIPLLAPHPSEWTTDGPSGGHGLASGTLTKIRGLLAKAESTQFEAEADALMAKAQELMTRHRIDRATLGREDPGQSEEVAARRLAIDDPYADAKSLLLAGIAEANGCRAVWSKDFGFSTVMGFRAEIEGVDELFTSLLVVADVALRREGSRYDRKGRSRTTRFRRSFLTAFAARIGKRLAEANESTLRSVEEETGTSPLPVLASRAQAADMAVERLFPELVHKAVSTSDLEGAMLGAKLADETELPGATRKERSALTGAGTGSRA